MLSVNAGQVENCSRKLKSDFENNIAYRASVAYVIIKFIVYDYSVTENIEKSNNTILRF